MEPNDIQTIIHAIDGVSSDVTALKDLFLRRLIDDKVKTAAIEKLSASNQELISCIDKMHFESIIKELFYICDRIDSKQDITDFEASIRDELHEIFLRRGIKLIPSQSMFDPAVHNAVKAIPSNDQYPPNTIVKIVRNGYMIDNHVLRPVDVIVSSDRV